MLSCNTVSDVLFLWYSKSEEASLAKVKDTIADLHGKQIKGYVKLAHHTFGAQKVQEQPMVSKLVTLESVYGDGQWPAAGRIREIKLDQQITHTQIFHFQVPSSPRSFVRGGIIGILSSQRSVVGYISVGMGSIM